MNRSLDCLFRPKSIAVVGASRKPGSIGSIVFHNLVRCGFQGPVYPVNPTADVIHSIRSYPSVTSIPEEIDLAVIVVPKQHVPAVVDDCIAKGVKGLVILSAGFGEVGGQGQEMQDEIVRKIREHGIRLVGPNCLGLLNTAPDVQMDSTFAPTWPPAGDVAFSSQSGALGLAILDYAQALGIGISMFVSVGNKADVSGNDLIEYWEADPATNVILLYLESFGNPRKFMQIAKRVSRHKPIAVVKSGRTAGGARAASSHTGALSSKDVAVQALLRQTGVIRTDTIEELFDMAMLLANQPIPHGNRVAIVTNAGGPGIMATDACESRGLVLAQLSDETQAALREFLPSEASVRNPVDMIASATSESFGRALPLIMKDDGVDAVLVLFVPPIITEAADVANAIRHGSTGFSKPVLTCFMGTHGIPKALSSLHEGRIPSYKFPEAAAIALARAVDYGQWLRTPEGAIPSLDAIDVDAARKVVHGATLRCDGEGAWLEPAEIDALLRAYGIPTLGSGFAKDDDEAVAVAERVGYPVAIKIASETITHKSDIGGVILAVESADGVRKACAAIRRNLERKDIDLAQMSGVTVQKMSAKGVETFIGMTREGVFGPLIAFGIGGTSVEIWKDVVFRVNPITDADARGMLEQIRGRRLLDGFRGSAPADRDAIVDALLRVSRMAEDLDEIIEFDINPLIAFMPGKGLVAADARIKVKAGS